MSPEKGRCLVTKRSFRAGGKHCDTEPLLQPLTTFATADAALALQKSCSHQSRTHTCSFPLWSKSGATSASIEGQTAKHCSAVPRARLPGPIAPRPPKETASLRLSAELACLADTARQRARSARGSATTKQSAPSRSLLPPPPPPPSFVPDGGRACQGELGAACGTLPEVAQQDLRLLAR
eukprot:3651418-Rhodomonas_salina.1